MRILKRGLVSFALSFLMVISLVSSSESKTLTRVQTDHIIVTSFDKEGWTWQSSGPQSPESIAGDQPSAYIAEVAAGEGFDSDPWYTSADYWYNVSIPPTGYKVAVLSILGGYPPHSSYCTGNNCGFWHDADYQDEGYLDANKMLLCSLYPDGPQIGVYVSEIAVGSPFMAVGLYDTDSAYVVEYNGDIQLQTVETIHKRRMGIPVSIINHEDAPLVRGAFYFEPWSLPPNSCKFGQICTGPTWICPHENTGTALFMHEMPIRTKVVLNGNIVIKQEPATPPMSFSVAGYVVSKDRKVIWPESFGATDENGQSWARFGAGSFGEPMIYVVPSNTPDSWSLFRHNNRSFTFRVGNSIRTGSDVSLLISPEESSPLTITVPSLYLDNYDTSTRYFHVVIGVAGVSSGYYHVAYEQEIPVGGQTSQQVILPDIVIPSELVREEGEIVVRALAYTDRGEKTIGEISLCGNHQMWHHICHWCFKLYDTVLARGFNTNRVKELASSLGFVPPVVMASLVGLGHPAYVFTDAYYMRYVGDVAQASIKTMPISLSVSGSTDVELGMNVHAAKQFWPNGSLFVVSTDVPLLPIIKFAPQLTVHYAITNTETGEVITGTVAPNLYQVKGQVLADFEDGFWYFGNLLGTETVEDTVISFAPTESPYAVPLVTYRESGTTSCLSGNTEEICNCIAFNIADCYHVFGNSIDVNGNIQARARASFTLPDGTVINAWSPWTPVTNLHWKAFLQQERR